VQRPTKRWVLRLGAERNTGRLLDVYEHHRTDREAARGHREKQEAMRGSYSSPIQHGTRTSGNLLSKTTMGCATSADLHSLTLKSRFICNAREKALLGALRAK
jgi:hypothetical protein